MSTRDVVIIGGGHNGLVAAAFLAKAGLKPLVLERAERVGGCAITRELAPGFRCPTLAHRAAVAPDIVRALNLERHGLHIVRPDAVVCTPALDRPGLTLWAEHAQASREIAARSPRDARNYLRFLESVAAVASVLRGLVSTRPPSLDRPTLGELVELLKTARRFRALPRSHAYQLLRWMPMPVADLVHEWFESEPLGAMIAAGGIIGSYLGPRSPGSAAVLLWLAAGEGHPIAPGWMPRGGIGALTTALARAAQEAGAEIRVGAEVWQIQVDGGAATGVVLTTGEKIAARAVVSNADPRRTLLGLVDSECLDPAFQHLVRNIRMRGTLAKINYAVSSLPRFTLSGVDTHREAAALSGCVRLCPEMDALERAFDAVKYGRYSEEPWIELTIPSLADPGLAPRGAHVVSAYVQFAPYELRGTTWEVERERFGDRATRTIARYAPGFERSIVARQIVTPLDLESEYGLTGGQIFHGEIALDQLLVGRPLLGWTHYRTPIRNLFLCGAGTHPGSGLDGRAGMLAVREIRRGLDAH